MLQNGFGSSVGRSVIRLKVVAWIHASIEKSVTHELVDILFAILNTHFYTQLFFPTLEISHNGQTAKHWAFGLHSRLKDIIFSHLRTSFNFDCAFNSLLAIELFNLKFGHGSFLTASFNTSIKFFRKQALYGYFWNVKYRISAFSFIPNRTRM